jgi:Na+-transporting methylmalonyl-CoA/oxaloacetate decarboxylase gamma subunit
MGASTTEMYVISTGVIIAFVVFFLLRAFLGRTRLFLNNYNKKKEVDKQEHNASPYSDEHNNDELAAVIMAAISASIGKPANKLKITSIKRTVDLSPAWGKAGRQSFLKNIFY